MEWLQVNVNLFPDSGGEQPYVPWATLALAVGEWRSEGRFERFWFVRKLPGLRLRFGGTDVGQMEPVLSSWLLAAERSNDIRGFRFGHYEPEVHRFGGPAGLAIAHELFDGDSALVLRYETLADGDRRRVSRHTLALGSSDDLFTRCLDDHAEVWDVWKRAEASVPVRPGDIVSGPMVAELRGLAARSATSLGDIGVALVAEAVAGNRRTAVALRSTVEAGRLTTGLRSWLVAVAAFQWNRWGLPLDLPLLACEVHAMAQELKPDGPVG